MSDWRSRAAQDREGDAVVQELQRLRAEAPETCALYEELLTINPREESRELYERLLFRLGQAASLGRNLSQTSRDAVRAYIDALKEQAS